MRQHTGFALLALTTAALFAACATAEGDGATDDGADDTTSSTATGTTTATATGTTSTGGSVSSSGGTTASSGTGGDPSGGSGGAGGADPSGGSGGAGAGTPGACAHEVCDIGEALVSGCDTCATDVCNFDDYCCSVEWDDLCVQGAVDLCNAPCAPPVMPLQPGDLIITEIMNNPEAVVDNSGEWFEVYNASAMPIDMLGMVIRHHYSDATKAHVIGSSVFLFPGDYAVLGKNSDKNINGNVSIDYVYGSDVFLGNALDYLAIQTNDATPLVIDVTEWDEGSGLDPAGRSRNLDPNFLSAADNDDDTNFCEATSQIVGGTDFGTPGAANDACVAPTN